MRGSASTGRPNQPDQVAALHLGSDFYQSAREVAVTGSEAVAVIDDDKVSVGGFPFGVKNHSVRGRVNLSVIEGGDVHAKVEFGLAVERIGSAAVVACDRAFDRPNTGG